MNEPVITDAVSAAVQLLILTLIPIFIAGAKVLIMDVFPSWGKKLKANLSEQQWYMLEQLAGVAVKYAEQLAKNEDVRNAGQYKYEQAKALIDETLAKNKLKFTTREIEAAIEAAVRDTFPKEEAKTQHPLEEYSESAAGELPK